MSQGGGSTQTTQTQTIPPWLQSAAQDFLGTAGQVAQLPFQPYNGQRVADLSPVQRQSIQGLSDLAGGTPYMSAAQDQLTQTLNGGFHNPFAQQGVGSGGQYQFNPISPGGQYQFNPVNPGGQFQFGPLGGGGQFTPQQISSGGQFNPASVDAGSNPYMGDNPYFQSSLNKGLDDITRAYRNGTAAQTDAMFANSHAFGGSAYQEAVGNNERQLGDTLNNYVNSARQGQYDRSANLAESGLSRNLNAQQFNDQIGNQAFESAAQRGLQSGQLNNQFRQSSFENAAQRNLNAGQFNANLGNQAFESAANRGLNAGQFNANLGNQAFESAATRGLNAGQFNANLGNQAFESAAQRGLNAGEFNANLGSQSYENERNRQMQGLGAATGLYGAQGNALMNALQGGNTERNQYQNLLDSQYQDFQDWRNYPDQRLQLFGNALAPIFGGSPRSTTTEQGLPPTDRVSQGLGIAALGSFLGRGSGK